jgi:hypothetical protein
MDQNVIRVRFIKPLTLSFTLHGLASTLPEGDESKVRDGKNQRRNRKGIGQHERNGNLGLGLRYGQQERNGKEFSIEGQLEVLRVREELHSLK